MWLLAMCSIVTPASAASDAARSRTRSRSVSGKFRVVEDADPSGIQVTGHPVGIANPRQRPGDHHPVVARQHPGNPVVVALRQRLRSCSPPASAPQELAYTRLIGSGSAGLGRSCQVYDDFVATKSRPLRRIVD